MVSTNLAFIVTSARAPPALVTTRTYVVVHYAGHATIVTSAHDDHTCVDLPQGRRVRAGGPVGGCAGRGAGRDVEAKGAAHSSQSHRQPRT